MGNTRGTVVLKRQVPESGDRRSLTKAIVDNSYFDVALLRLETDLLFQSRPLARPASLEPPFSANLDTIASPWFFLERKFVRISGKMYRLTDLGGKSLSADNLFYLRRENGKANEEPRMSPWIQEGMSGSPVIADGNVVGMISVKLNFTQKDDGDSKKEVVPLVQGISRFRNRLGEQLPSFLFSGS